MAGEPETIYNISFEGTQDGTIRGWKEWEPILETFGTILQAHQQYNKGANCIRYHITIQCQPPFLYHEFLSTLKAKWVSISPKKSYIE
jgi:hypothetical protein